MTSAKLEVRGVKGTDPSGAPGDETGCGGGNVIRFLTREELAGVLQVSIRTVDAMVAGDERVAYPIVWTDVLEPYGTAANADKPLAVFGALSFWWFGEHGSPRIDTSEHVWFANDQLAVRFIEEIDFDFCAIDSTAVMLTAPAA